MVKLDDISKKISSSMLSDEISLTFDEYDFSVSISEEYFKQIQFNNKCSVFIPDNVEIFKRYYEKLGNIDSVIRDISGMAEKLVSNFTEEISKILLEMEKFEYSLDSLFEIINKHKCLLPYIDAYSEIESQYDKIIYNQKQQEDYRKSRKEFRHKYDSYDFNGDSFDRNAKSIGLNILSGIGHSIVNSIGDAMSEAEAKERKLILYRAPITKDALLNGLKQTFYLIIETFSNLLFDATSQQIIIENQKKAKNLFENIEKANLPKKKYIAQISKCINFDISNEIYFERLFEFFKDDYEKIEQLFDFTYEIRGLILGAYLKIEYQFVKNKIKEYSEENPYYLKSIEYEQKEKILEDKTLIFDDILHEFTATLNNCEKTATEKKLNNLNIIQLCMENVSKVSEKRLKLSDDFHIEKNNIEEELVDLDEIYELKEMVLDENIFFDIAFQIQGEDYLINIKAFENCLFELIDDLTKIQNNFFEKIISSVDTKKIIRKHLLKNKEIELKEEIYKKGIDFLTIKEKIKNITYYKSLLDLDVQANIKEMKSTYAEDFIEIFDENDKFILDLLDNNLSFYNYFYSLQKGITANIEKEIKDRYMYQNYKFSNVKYQLRLIKFVGVTSFILMVPCIALFHELGFIGAFILTILSIIIFIAIVMNIFSRYKGEHPVSDYLKK